MFQVYGTYNISTEYLSIHKMGVFYIQLLSVNGYDVNSPVKVIIEAINTAVYLQQSFVERTPLEFHMLEC